MSNVVEEHEVRSAVARLADRARTSVPPGAAIVRAGARRRVRNRAGAAGALALAATLAVSVSVSAFSTDRGSQSPASETGISNAFTEQLGRTLEQGFPAGTHVNVRMLAGIDPSTRYDRFDHFLVRITAKGRESDAVLKLSTEVSNPQPTAAFPATQLELVTNG